MCLRIAFEQTLLLVVLVSTWSGLAAAKKLVVVVGPHGTHTGTTSFLSRHAANNGSGSSSFGGWSWPIVENEAIDSRPQRVFDLLVKENENKDIQDVLVSAIRSAWEASKNGIFMGSLDFDKVGTNPYSGYDPISALHRVVDELGVNTSDVLVIVAYRSPRINQWSNVWNNHFDAVTYEDFICSEHQSDKRWEWLDTSINPLGIAQAYSDQGWNVSVFDEESTIRAGKDVAHVVACFAMENKNCEDGWVDGLERLPPGALIADPIDELQDEDRSDLESLFLFRDCFYFLRLDGSRRFELFDRENGFESLTNGCNHWLEVSYARFADTTSLMNAIQSQKNCEQDDIDVPSLLTNEPHPSESKDGGSDDNSSLIDGCDGKDCDVNKKLIVFVGPHETQAVEVTKFFLKYASDYGDSDPSSSFEGWIWPYVHDETISKPSYRLFDLLVTDPEDEHIQNVVIKAIVDSWNNANNGVVIGSLDLDRVGKNPDSQYDPIGALRRVVDAIGVANDSVTVVVTYRSPRIDHWSAVWNNHFGSTGYEDFLCTDGEKSNKRWEWLDTVMNPFKIATAYKNQGFNVAVIDQEGTFDAGLDVAHTIACDVMDSVECEGGWIKGLEDVIIDHPTIFSMDFLEEEDHYVLEQIFLNRDCFYKYELKARTGFEIVHQRTAWSSCSGQHLSFYERFTDTEFVLELLKSLMKCGESYMDTVKLLREKMFQDKEKQLVIFAGPHETSAVPVTKFFVNHASKKEGTIFSSSLASWSWPIIDSEIVGSTASHRTFDLLLSDAKTRPVQNIILDGIRDSWNSAPKGVIIGSLGLDRVGKNPYSSYDPLGAIDRVMGSLGISDNDVTLVLNYRSTRLDHLSAVWWNHFNAESFHEFVCSDAEVEKRWEWMDTVMNPFKVANAFTEEGWKVAMIDQEGTLSAGKDVAHALACEIMNDVDCSRGWIRGLEHETIDPPPSYDIDDLDKLQLTQLEALFQMRDCNYKYTLEPNARFSLVNKEGIWKSCRQENRNEYEKLIDTDFLLGVMGSLVGCEDTPSPQSLQFATEMLSSDSLSTFKHNNSPAIAAIVSSVTVVVLLGLLLHERKRKKTSATAVGPSEGVFRDHPHARESSQQFTDEDREDEITYEDNFDDEDGTSVAMDNGSDVEVPDLDASFVVS